MNARAIYVVSQRINVTVGRAHEPSEGPLLRGGRVEAADAPKHNASAFHAFPLVLTKDDTSFGPELLLKRPAPRARLLGRADGLAVISV